MCCILFFGAGRDAIPLATHTPREYVNKIRISHDEPNKSLHHLTCTSPRGELGPGTIDSRERLIRETR